MNNFDKSLLCLGIIGKNGLYSSDAEQLPREISAYFSRAFKNDCGKVLFLTAWGDIILKSLENLSAEELSFFGLR